MSTKGLAKDLMKTFNILNEAKHFSSGIFQNYLVFIPAKKYIKYFGDTTGISLWKSNEISKENIENITKSDRNFAPIFADRHLCMYVYIYIIFLSPKSKKSLYFLDTNSTGKKFK